MTLQNLVTVLNVSDIESGLEFYRDALDFKLVSDSAAVKRWRWATIRSARTELMLSQTDSPPPGGEPIDPHSSSAWPCIFYFYPDDVARLYAQVIARGYRPTPMIDTRYSMREFSLQDPDGHLLSFGQDARQAAAAKTDDD